MLHVERKHNTAHNAKDKDNKKLRNNNEEPFILKNIWLYTKSRQKERKKEEKDVAHTNAFTYRREKDATE
jgi:hypothetical protein